ncbi:hypothetical protein Y032_0038g3591 [Ancylostoma ceylanicum]|uniref:Uncharacterized protein n=1 Tax=Ancylostoma ceylanicum TaxID=53326 RepID=A0A016UI60_9BILA|nr:hypothetical protein Y032_0038g3591 [Ancylostoma ceylanicum]
MCSIIIFKNLGAALARSALSSERSHGKWLRPQLMCSARTVRGPAYKLRWSARTVGLKFGALTRFECLSGVRTRMDKKAG